jgi:hypothetical protein
MLRWLVVLSIVVAAVPARAETVNFDALVDQIAASSPGLERIAKGAFRRARRAVSIGPTVGGFGGVFGGDTGDGAISFGLGLEVFEVPIVPSPDNIKALVIQRAKEKLKARQLSTADAQQVAREAWDEAIKELFGIEGLKYNTMEKPRFSVALEGNRFFDGEAWAFRMRAGIGIWKVTVAASFATAFFDETRVYAGFDISTHFLVAKRPRSSVLDVFVRADFGLKDRDVANSDFYGVGVRYLLDAF